MQVRVEHDTMVIGHPNVRHRPLQCVIKPLNEHDVYDYRRVSLGQIRLSSPPNHLTPVRLRYRVANSWSDTSVEWDLRS